MEQKKFVPIVMGTNNFISRKERSDYIFVPIKMGTQFVVPIAIGTKNNWMDIIIKCSNKIGNKTL